MLNNNAPFVAPASSSIGDVIKKEGLITPFKKRQLTPGNVQSLTSVLAVNQEPTDFVKNCHKKVFRENGLPDVIRTDNGRPFAGNGIAGLSQLSIWLIKLGILPERIQKGKPSQNGRHERMHRSLKAALKHGHIYPTLEEQQNWFNHYRHEFNYERPHEVHSGQTPSSHWNASCRLWDGLLEVDDGLYMIVFDRLILAYYDKIEHQLIYID